MENFCLLIVLNREKFLNSIYNYYHDANFKILIAHNIKKEISKPLNKNIQTIYIDEELAVIRTRKALEYINEKYIMLFSDDDFVISQIIKKSLTFLKNNSNFSNAHGIQLSFDVSKKKLFSNPDRIDLPMVNFNDTKNIKIRLFESFITKYDDKIYSLMNKKLFQEIYISFKHLEKKYPRANECFINSCICLVGQTKVFNEIGWFKRNHDLNAWKNEDINSFESYMTKKEFLYLFKKSLTEFCKKNNIKKNNVYFIIFLLFLLKIKITLLGRFKFLRTILKYFVKKKRFKMRKINNLIYAENIRNFEKIEKILNQE